MQHMTKEHLFGQHQLNTEPESMQSLKDEIMSAWRQLPPEQQATMALVLLDTILNGKWGQGLIEAIDTLWQDVYMHSAPETATEPPEEIMDRSHFYAAFVFDCPDTRALDIKALIWHAQQLGYPVRYWWLSETMKLHDTPDRLIVCVLHPTMIEFTGNYLSDRLLKDHFSWDALEGASMEEYCRFGKPVSMLDDIRLPEGQPLFR